MFRKTILTIFLIFSASVQAVTVNLESKNSEIEKDSSFSVLVKGMGFPEVGGATLGLKFDADVINVTDILLADNSPFDFLQSTTFDNVEGKVELISVIAPLAGDLPKNDFDAFLIDFTSVGVGSSAIELVADDKVTGWTGGDLSLISNINYNQGLVTVSAVPLPGALWLMFSAFAFLGLGVKKTISIA